MTAPSLGTVAAHATSVARLAIAVPLTGEVAMHVAPSPETLHRWHDKVTYAFQPHMADAEHPAPTRLADNPLRARLRPVRLVPLVVPGMALVLASAAMAIGWLMRT